MPYTYLILNLAVISVPLWRTYDRKVGIHKLNKAIWGAILLTSVLFILWDIHFTKEGVWGFNPKFHLDLYLINLPISEVLFFLTVPYACIFSYLVIEYFFGWHKLLNFNSKIISYTLATTFFALAALNTGKEYTFWASLSAFAILLINIISKADFLSRFYVVYLILMVPFIITNGFLTGSFTDEPVVWYNDMENLGIRFMRIPLDDFIYNFALLLINITLFERFRKTLGIGFGKQSQPSESK